MSPTLTCSTNKHLPDFFFERHLHQQRARFIGFAHKNRLRAADVAATRRRHRRQIRASRRFAAAAAATGQSRQRKKSRETESAARKCGRHENCCGKFSARKKSIDKKFSSVKMQFMVNEKATANRTSFGNIESDGSQRVVNYGTSATRRTNGLQKKRKQVGSGSVLVEFVVASQDASLDPTASVRPNASCDATTNSTNTEPLPTCFRFERRRLQRKRRLPRKSRSRNSSHGARGYTGCGDELGRATRLELQSRE